jgi:3-(3-hydroxy-phenyl)propionate hydroxylase
MSTPPSRSGTACDVLVVGLGPVGAVLACLLRTHGLSVIAVDKEPNIHRLPRAGSFDDDAMRVLQSIGLADALLPQCRVLHGYKFRSAAGEVLMEFDMPPGPGPTGWDTAYVMHQPSVEHALRQRLRELGADARLSTRLTGFTQREDHVSAQVQGPAGPDTIDARFLIGCDGANSTIRDAVSPGVFDYGFSESWLVIDATTSAGHTLPEGPMQICDPARPTTMMRMTGSRYRWEFMLTPNDDSHTIADQQSLARLLAPWTRIEDVTIDRTAVYRFRGLVADTWRSGRTLLAGDAAHLMPPFAGQGMCSGFRDAVNLAWKIAAVHRGDAADRLLDTYQQEREPHVRTLIERSIQFGQVVCILDPDLASRRDADLIAMRATGHPPTMQPPPALQRGCLTEGADSGTSFPQPTRHGARLDDALGPGAWLISRIPANRPSNGITHRTIGSTDLAPFHDAVLQWLDERRAEAVLVRPDRVVFGVGDPDDLTAAWHDHLHDQHR